MDGTLGITNCTKIIFTKNNEKIICNCPREKTCANRKVFKKLNQEINDLLAKTIII